MADEYINKTELLFEMATSLIPQSMDITLGYVIAKDLIQKAPVVDVAPVAHGEWRLETDTEQPNPMFKLVVCSNCNSKANHTYPYCPYCGANNLSEEIKQGTDLRRKI